MSKLGGTLEGFDRYMNDFGYRTYVITQDDQPIALSELKDMEVVVFQA